MLIHRFRDNQVHMLQASLYAFLVTNKKIRFILSNKAFRENVLGTYEYNEFQNDFYFSLSLDCDIPSFLSVGIHNFHIV